MRARILALAVLLLPAPALAQHDHHASHGGEPAAPQAPQSDPPAVHDHADHGAAEPDPTVAPQPATVGPPAAALTGPENAADLYFGSGAMAEARRELGRMHGAVPAHRVMVERLEAQVAGGTDRYLFDAQAWYGGDIDKLWLKTELEGEFGGAFEGGEIQVLWSHAIGPWFDLQAGGRLDAGPGSERGHLVLGVQGLAPYWIEVDAAAFVSDRGDVTARIEAEHDVRLTQRLILQPRAELEFALQDIPDERIGSGLVGAALGARLRYQVTQLVAPYVGVEYRTAAGRTRDFRRADGEDPEGIYFLAGVRAWF